MFSRGSNRYFPHCMHAHDYEMALYVLQLVNPGSDSASIGGKTEANNSKAFSITMLWWLLD